ncbi:hypothetical protein B0H16DRAFT_1668785 [Mycena metata]|uniref:DNA breaking-rejoining enzyme n=1 Tax=Mycena metata TaxID=1033252 RepID=A0AAD7GPR6_9AGAR|nr:hypothetical protein B0H16DRAFT_1668785 [Mycena metata]
MAGVDGRRGVGEWFDEPALEGDLGRDREVRSVVIKRGVFLFAEATSRLKCALSHAGAKNTVAKYSGSLNEFHVFCDHKGVTLAQWLPANKFLLCAFAASKLSEIAGGTVRGAISVDTEWKGGLCLCYTLKGVENIGPAKLDNQPPVTAQMVDVLSKELDHNDPKDSAVFATACCSLWGQLCLGEILSDTQSKYTTGHIPLASDLKPPSTPAGSHVRHLPWTKTSRSRGKDAMLWRQSGPSDPIGAVENHITVNTLPAHAPLFSHRNAKGASVCLTRKKFLKHCNEIWRRHGFPAFTDHSFRIRGTTELLLAGVNPDIVQAMGRWLLDSFKVYWRRLDLLALLHAEYIDV